MKSNRRCPTPLGARNRLARPAYGPALLSTRSLIFVVSHVPLPCVFAKMRLVVTIWVVGTIILTMGCGPPGWEAMSSPDLHETNAMAAVEGLLATNGWDMSLTPLDFAFGVTKPPTLRGLPWRRYRDRAYPALSHGGILCVALEGFHHDVIGVAYNPKTNAFHPAVVGFKPLADHWYVWTSTDDPVKLTKRYEGAH